MKKRKTKEASKGIELTNPTWTIGIHASSNVFRQVNNIETETHNRLWRDIHSHVCRELNDLTS